MISSWLSGGARLTFSDTGAGLPVLFLHPTPLDHDYWRPLADPSPRRPRPFRRPSRTRRLRTRRFASQRRLPPRSRCASPHHVSIGRRHPRPDRPARSASGRLHRLLHRRLCACLNSGSEKAPDRVRGLTFMCSKPQPDAEANLQKRAANIAQARAGGNSGAYGWLRPIPRWCQTTPQPSPSRSFLSFPRSHGPHPPKPKLPSRPASPRAPIRCPDRCPPWAFLSWPSPAAKTQP